MGVAATQRASIELARDNDVLDLPLEYESSSVRNDSAVQALAALEARVRKAESEGYVHQFQLPGDKDLWRQLRANHYHWAAHEQYLRSLSETSKTKQLLKDTLSAWRAGNPVPFHAQADHLAVDCAVVAALQDRLFYTKSVGGYVRRLSLGGSDIEGVSSCCRLILRELMKRPCGQLIEQVTLGSGDNTVFDVFAQLEPFPNLKKWIFQSRELRSFRKLAHSSAKVESVILDEHLCASFARESWPELAHLKVNLRSRASGCSFAIDAPRLRELHVSGVSGPSVIRALAQSADVGGLQVLRLEGEHIGAAFEDENRWVAEVCRLATQEWRNIPTILVYSGALQRSLSGNAVHIRARTQNWKLPGII